MLVHRTLILPLQSPHIASFPMTYRDHQVITDDLLPELEITPHAIFQRAGLNL